MAAESPASFATAREGEAAFLTPPFTTQPSRSPSASATNAPPPRYRQAGQLPYELAHHCSVYLESGQYLQAFSLLTSLLRSGALSGPSSPLPAQIPPPQLFEVSATLIVHPAVTTRASTPEKLHAANAAARYLRDVNRTIGPVNARFANVFAFRSARGRGGRKRGILGSPSGTGKAEEERPINSAMANKNSLWNNADDFWNVLGWAFNCSVRYKSRWERWKMWLELMLEVMEDDWNERIRLRDEELAHDDAAGDDILLQSIIVQYLLGANAGSLSARRKILRAILADGSSHASNEFKEVFVNELKERKKEADIKPIREMDLEKGDLGDLGFDPNEEEDLDDGDPNPTPGQPTRRSGRSANARRSSVVSLGSTPEDDTDEDSVSPVDRLGGMDSVRMRQRILAFLATVTEKLPSHITTREQLFDSYTEHLRPLPAPIFTTLVRTSLLPSSALCVLAANTLLPLLPTSPPTYDVTPPSQDEWMEHFLPFSANTHGFSDNAKVSVLLQHVLQINLPTLEWSKAFVDAVLKGVRARRKKARGKNKTGGGGLRADEVVAEKVFQESEQFLLLLVQWVEDDADVPQAQRPPRQDLLALDSVARESSMSDLTSVPSDAEDGDSDEMDVVGDVQMRD